MSRQIALALTVLALLIGATVAADRVLAAPSPPDADFDEDITVDSGAWYCVPIAREGETATVTVAAVGDGPSQVSVTTVSSRDAERGSEDRVELRPGDTQQIEIDGGDRPTAVVVRWRGAPVTTSWQVATDDGLLGSSCATSPAPRWLLPGATTVIGSKATAYLFNPFETDAVARVYFTTPEGRVDLVSSENLSVPAGSVISVDISRLQPEQPDLGIVVEVDAGRIIASGLQEFGQPDLPDVDLEDDDAPTDPAAPNGRTVLHGYASADSTASYSYLASAERSASWVTVLNPNDRPARVTLRATDQIEGELAGQETVVGPESVVRIDLDAVSSAPDFAVTLESADDVGFVATAFTSRDVGEGAVSSTVGVREPDATNVAAIVPTDDTADLVLYNPGDSAASVTASVAGAAPDDWSAIDLAPGSLQRLPFADVDLDDGGAPVVVTSDEPINGALRFTNADDRGLLIEPLVPANAWQGSANALAPRRDRTLETTPVTFPARPD